MFADDVRECCLRLPSVTEEEPFGPDVLVYKVEGKMFATLGIDEGDGFGRTNLKCDPDRSPELRREHAAIEPGYHMNKKHWNTVYVNGPVPQKLVRELIDHSYDLVFKSLPNAKRESLE